MSFQSRIGKVLKWLGIVVVAMLLLLILLLDGFKVFSVKLPPVAEVELLSLDQGWKAGWEIGEREWFHHADQGTKILPLSWFLALEQPELSVLRRPGKFSDPEYLRRFGFVASSADPESNPYNLPVGFAVNRAFQEPQANAPPPYAVVGLTCAACHTGQINYQGKGLRIDGGSAMIDAATFETALGHAMVFTRKLPWRFNRFAREALGDRYSAETKLQLRDQLDKLIHDALQWKAYVDSKGSSAPAAGIGRTDALGTILNRVFDPINWENFRVTDAPVNFPHIWDSSWFEWVQYNASIRTPMARNIGEAIGVNAMINLPGKGGKEWNSTVNVPNLHLMEKQLAGEEPFGGLRSPKWPSEVLGELDPDLVQFGAQLYKSKGCSDCHWLVEDIKSELAELEDPNGRAEPQETRMWTARNRFGKRFINTSETVINLEEIGTDSTMAVNFARRVAVTVKLRQDVADGYELSVAGAQLAYFTNRVRQVEYQKMGFLDEHGQTIDAKRDLKLEYDAYRLPWEEFLREEVTAILPDGKPDGATVKQIQAALDDRRDAFVRLAYKARPLNGVWATAPYLHNGSVRNLYQLLSPVPKRDKTFHVGTKEFDPVNVGYENTRVKGGFVLDTSLHGNFNTGHEFRDKTREEQDTKWIKGVLGPALHHEERMALIEYLKSL